MDSKRLSRDSSYNRPNKTYQEMLSNEEIKEKLKDYKKVNDIKKVSIGSHLRYFTIDKKSKEKYFRLGGTLTKFGENGEYIILSNGKVTWSVQIGNSIFFQKMTEQEFKEELKREIRTEIMTEQQDDDINLKSEIKMLRKKLEKFDDLKNKNEILSQQLSKIEKEIKKEKSKKK